MKNIVIWSRHIFLIAFAVGGMCRHASADEQLHEGLAMLAAKVGGLSPAQQAKVDALEKELEKLPPQQGSAELIPKFSAILTPAQRTKFDAFIAEQNAKMKQALTGMRLKMLSLSILRYQNAHGLTYPPKLSALAGPGLDLNNFVSAESNIKAPADLAAKPAEIQAQWVEKNSDYVYLFNGKNADALFTIAYSPAGLGQFLNIDGSVYAAPSAAAAAKWIAELKAGKNPSPAMMADSK